MDFGNNPQISVTKKLPWKEVTSHCSVQWFQFRLPVHKCLNIVINKIWQSLFYGSIRSRVLNIEIKYRIEWISKVFTSSEEIQGKQCLKQEESNKKTPDFYIVFGNISEYIMQFKKKECKKNQLLLSNNMRWQWSLVRGSSQVLTFLTPIK